MTERDQQIAEARRVHDVAYGFAVDAYTAGDARSDAVRGAAFTAARNAAAATYRATLDRIDKEYPA